MDWELIIGTTLRAFVGVQACYFALAAIGLNVHYGYTGLANFGQVAFVAVGSYCDRHGRRDLRLEHLAGDVRRVSSPPSCSP